MLATNCYCIVLCRGIYVFQCYIIHIQRHASLRISFYVLYVENENKRKKN